MTVAVFFLSAFVSALAYTTKNANTVHEMETPTGRGSITQRHCCSCFPASEDDSEKEYRVEDCCPCPLTSEQGRIPLEPFISDRFHNAEGDGSVKSCSLIAGDLLLSPPSCVSYKKGRVDCFYVNAETQSVSQKTMKDGDTPQASVDIKGKVRDEVVAVAVSENKSTLVALNQSNHLISKMMRGGRWTDWMVVEDATALEVPAVFMRTSGGVTCFYRTLDNTLWYVDRSRFGAWGRPKKLDIEFMTSPPTCLERGDDDVEECFVLADDNSVAHQQWIFGGEWMLQPRLGGLGKQRISVVSLGYDRVDIFVLGANSQLMHRALVEEEWKEWEDLGGSFVSAPECVAVGEEAIHCFLIGVDRTLMHAAFDGFSWTKWVSSSNAMIEKPTCVASDDETISCYSRGYTGHMIEMVYSI